MAVEYQLHGSGTRTSLGFSAIEKHWKIRSSHRFYGVYASKMEKQCAWGTCNTDSRYPERMGNIIYFILFPKPKQNRAKCPHSPPIPMKTKTFIFWLSYSHYVTIFICSSRTLMLSCALARYLWLKLANVKVSEYMLMYKPK